MTITGGKLTTFRLMALDALKAIRAEQPGVPVPPVNAPVLNTVDVDELDLQHLGTATRRRLRGRYGAHALDLVARAQPGELEPVPGTQILWAELRWADGWRDGERDQLRREDFARRALGACVKED